MPDVREPLSDFLPEFADLDVIGDFVERAIDSGDGWKVTILEASE